MNKKGIFFLSFFLCLFVFPRFFSFSRFPFPGLTPCLGFLLSLTHALLFFAFFFRICFSSWTQPLFRQMIFWVCTTPMSYQAKSIMSSLLLIFLLSWPSPINITKDNLLDVAARCNSLHLSLIDDWGGLKHAFCHLLANKSSWQDMISISLLIYVSHHEPAQLNMWKLSRMLSAGSRKVHPVV